MSQTVNWPPIGGTSYSVPEASEEDWAALTNYLVALSGAQTTTAQKFGVRTATVTPATMLSVSDCVLLVKLTAPGPSVVNLPVGVVGQVLMIADGTGDAATNPVTVTPNVGQTINGAASYPITINRGAIIIIFSGAGNWTVIAQTTTGGGGTVARSNVSAGTPGYNVFNNATTGLLDQEQFVSAVRGGLGADASAFTGYLKASSGVFTASGIAAVDLPTGIVSTKIGTGTVDNTEFGYLDGVTSPLQAQIDTKVTGQASSIDNEIALFSGTTGKLIKRASGTGIAVITAGVLAFATFDNITPAQAGNAGKALITNGSTASWQAAIVGYTTSVITANPSPAVNNTQYLANTTSAAFSVTLPSGFTGAKIKIQDGKGTWDTNNLTIIPATGERIYPLAANVSLVCNVVRGWIELCWDGAGWSPNSLASTTLGSGSGLIGVNATTTTSAVNGVMYECDTTSAGFTLTLPAGTSAAVVGILDAGPFFATNNLLVAPASGQSIDVGAANDTLTIDVNRANVVFYRSNGSTLWEIQTSSLTSYAPGFQPGYTGTTAISAGNVGERIINETYITTTVGVGTTNYDLIVSIPLTPGVWDIKGFSITTGTASNVQTLVWLTSDSTLANNPTTADFGRGLSLRTIQNSAQSITNAPVMVDGLLVTTSTTYWLRIKQVGASASVNCALYAKRTA